MKPTIFFAATDLIVTGHNPEMADVDNPTGAIHGYASFVIAEDAQGNRRRHHIKNGALHEEQHVMQFAERQAQALNVRLGKGLLPIAFDAWADHSPAYGTQAWCEYGEAETASWERDQDGFEQGWF